MKAPKGDKKGSNAGAPTLYREQYAEQAYKLCLLGSTDAELADFFNVTEQTVNNWKTAHPEFFESIRKGKEIADAEVADSLYQRAKGYSHPEDKIFQYEGAPVVVPTIKHYPPDTAAAIIWLKNRQPKKWRDKQPDDEGDKVQKIEIVRHRKHVDNGDDTD